VVGGRRGRILSLSADPGTSNRKASAEGGETGKRDYGKAKVHGRSLFERALVPPVRFPNPSKLRRGHTRGHQFYIKFEQTKPIKRKREKYGGHPATILSFDVFRRDR
jgi:hypothetical protein